MATSTQTFEKKSSPPAAALAAAAVLAVAGLAAWGYQLSAGLHVTGLGQQVVWGLYIAAFFTAVGAGGALLALAGLAAFVPSLRTIERRGLLSLALASFVAGGLLITMDVGNPLQLWRIIASFQLASLMTWDFWLLVAAGVITLVYRFAVREGQPNQALGALAVLGAVAVVAVEGWMLSTLAARSMWGSGLTLVSFLVGAVVAGLGLAALLLPGTGRLRPALAAFLALNLVLVAAEVLTGLVSGQEEMRLLLAGPAAPVFWFHLLAGLLLPLALLRSGTVQLAGVLALIGVLAEKVWMLAAGQAEPWLELPSGSYFPSWVEFAAVLGVIALAWLVYEGLQRLRK